MEEKKGQGKALQRKSGRKWGSAGTGAGDGEGDEEAIVETWNGRRWLRFDPLLYMFRNLSSHVICAPQVT